MNYNKNKIILSAIMVILSAVIWCGCNQSENQLIETPDPITTEIQEKAEVTTEQTDKIEKEIVQNEQTTAEQAISEEEQTYELTCGLFVTCDNALKNISKLDKEKVGIIPQSGVIFSKDKIVFDDGESAFDVILREMEKNNIPIDYEKNTIYNSVYIKGIANLYEKDCGNFSGWIYKINGEFQNKGCSEYKLKDGDKIEFIYSCG